MPSRAHAWATAGGAALVLAGLLWLCASVSGVVTTGTQVDASLTGPGLGSALGAAGHAWLWRAGEVAPMALGVIVLVRRRAGVVTAVVAGALGGALVAAAGVVDHEARAYAALQSQGGAAIAPSVVGAWGAGPAVAWVVAAAALGALGSLAVAMAWASGRFRA